MNEKWLRFPYYAPAGADSGGTSDNRGTEADADFLGEGEDDNNEDVDNKDDDSKNDDEDTKDDKKRKPQASADRLRDKADSSDDEGKSEKLEDFEEDDDEEKIDEDEDEEDTDDEKEEKDDTDDDVKELENEFTVRALKEKFPGIFKAFPEVKEAIFREREFTKLFGSVDEAQEASAKAQYLDEISQELYEGKSENLLGAMKKNNEKSLQIFAHNFMPQLFKTDKDLYHEVGDNFINQTLRVILNNANKNSNKNLATAVKYISQFVFGEPELPELKNNVKAPEKSEAELKLEQQKKEFAQQKYSEFEDSVHTKARNRLSDIVKEGFKDEEMTDFVKDAVTEKIIDKVGLIIAKDKFFQSKLASMWRSAVRDGYTGEAKSRIISAYLARAKKIVPSVRAQVRKDATSRRANNNTEIENKNGKRQGTSSGSGKRHSSLPTDPRKIPASISDEDLLGMD